MAGWTLETLKQHFEALRELDKRQQDQERLDAKEKFSAHNDLLQKWQEATALSKSELVSKDAFDAHKREFYTYKEITAKALTLAEGKAQGHGATGTIILNAVSIVASIASVIGVVYLVLKGN